MMFSQSVSNGSNLAGSKVLVYWQPRPMHLPKPCHWNWCWRIQRQPCTRSRRPWGLRASHSNVRTHRDQSFVRCIAIPCPIRRIHMSRARMNPVVQQKKRPTHNTKHAHEICMQTKSCKWDLHANQTLHMRFTCKPNHANGIYIQPTVYKDSHLKTSMQIRIWRKTKRTRRCRPSMPPNPRRIPNTKTHCNVQVKVNCKSHWNKAVNKNFKFSCTL